MKLLSLAAGVSASAVAAQAGVACNKTPFLAGRDVVVNVSFGPGTTGAPVVKIQGSVDNVTYVDLAVSAGLANLRQSVPCYPYMRANMTTAGTAGLYSAAIENAT